MKINANSNNNIQNKTTRYLTKKSLFEFEKKMYWLQIDEENLLKLFV